MSPADAVSISRGHIAQQALYFGLIVVITSLSGVTLLRLLRICVPPRLAVFVGPPLTLAAWTIMLGIGIGAGLPLDHFYLVGWAATLGLAAYACRPASLRAIKPDWRVGLAVLAAPVAIAEPYFRWGLTTFAGSPYLDGWSYVAFGQYVWEYPRQTDGGLAPLYQYSAVLSHTRYIGSAMLGFISPLLGSAGDTQPAMGVVLVLALFALACACVVLAASFGLGGWATSSLVVLVVYSGWSVGLFTSNALDNSLALYALPVLVGAARLADLRRFGWWLLLAVFVCALVYTYPELAWVGLLSFGVVLAQRLVCLRSELRALVAPAVGAALVASVLLAPFAATDLIGFFGSHAGSAVQPGVARPGEALFHELTQPTRMVWSFWGLTNETALCSRCAVQLGAFLLDGRVLLGLILTGLAGLGFGVLVRRRELAVCLAVLTCLCAAALLAVWLEYGYGAFKILVVGWSLLVLCIVLGGAAVVRACQATRYSGWGRAAAAAVVGLYAYGVSTQVRAFGDTVPTTTFATYDAVRTAGSIAGPAPILVAVSNQFANSWAVYELRESSIVLDSYAGYMAQVHVIPSMERAGVPTGTPIRYVLTDATPPSTPDGFQSVWSQGPYALWHALDDNWAFVSRVDAPNGVEQWSSGPAFWVGKAPVDLEITASRADQACLHAVFTPGPSIPEQRNRRVAVSGAGVADEVLQSADEQSEMLTLSVVPGVTRVSLTALDPPTLVPLPGGELRTLLVGVQKLGLTLGTCPAT